jgi:Protein of unknown function (DUF1524)
LGFRRTFRAEKKDALDFLLSFIVRRAVCALSNKNYNNLFLSAIAQLDRVGWTIGEFQKFFLNQKSNSGRLPKDEEFTRLLASAPIYTTLGSARTKAILHEVELRKRGKYQETQGLPDDLSVEHIMPSAWRTRWPMKDGLVPTETDFTQAQYWSSEDDSSVGLIVKRNRLKHSIGNLTLVTPSFNSKPSNEAFEVKRKEFEDQSVLMMTRDVVKKQNWDESEILARGKSIAEMAREIWASPKFEEKTN